MRKEAKTVAVSVDTRPDKGDPLSSLVNGEPVGILTSKQPFLSSKPGRLRNGRHALVTPSQ